MPGDSGLADFKQGVSLLRKGQSGEALEYFRRAAGLEQQNPYYLSFLGVCMARAQSKWTAAVELCKTAINMKRKEAQLYMNLADVPREKWCPGSRSDVLHRPVEPARDFGNWLRVENRS